MFETFPVGFSASGLARSFTFAQIVLAFCCVSAADSQTANPPQVDEPQRPNILFILSDDQGWPTLSCYGNKYVKTPHLDRMASAGIRFTDAYVMPQCTPTRAALLTGDHTARNGMWHVIGWYGTPWAPVSEPPFLENLSPLHCHLPRLLRDAGYRTGMAGKWHLTNNEHGHYVYLKKSSADRYGFDHVAPPGEGSQNEGDKWVDHLTEEACQFIRRNRENRWFFYLSHHTLHNKISAPQHLVSKHLSNGAPETGYHNASYLASIEHLDNSIGKLFSTLKDLSLVSNTMVVFLSDNGGIDTSLNLPQWDDAPLDGSQPLTVKEHQFDNAPLREGKGSVYEGGIRVPCLVQWPDVIEPGQVCDTPIHVVDWLPTLMNAAGKPLSNPIDGTDLGPLFRGKAIEPRSLFWYLPLYDLRWGSTPSAIIRKGDWKLIEHFGDYVDRNRQYRLSARTELYHLGNDIGETNDLSESKPELANELRTELLNWIRSVPATVPGTNPHHDVSKRLLETKEKQSWNVP